MSVEQESLWHDSIYDALKACIRAIASAKHPGIREDAGFKQVGLDMWPTMTADRAGQKLANKLNPDTRDILHPHELVYLLAEARKIGCHTGMAYLCDEAGYRRADPVEPKDEITELQRKSIAMYREQKELCDRMERLIHMSSSITGAK